LTGTWSAAADTKLLKYTLQAVVFHSGWSMDSGHYTAAIKHRGHWYRCDDAEVRRMDLADIARAGVSTMPYMLLYRRT